MYGLLSIVSNKMRVKSQNAYNVESLDIKVNKRNTRFKKYINRLISNTVIDKLFGTKVKRIEKKLEKANYPLNLLIEDLIFLYIAIPLSIGLAVGVIFSIVGASYYKIGLYMAVAAGVCILLIKYFVNNAIKSRKRKAVKELPDFIDILTINLEAGLGFDLALKRILEKEEGILTEEFNKYLREIEIGSSRKIALENLAERLDIEAMSMLVKSIIQAEELGVSIVKILRVQSVELREKRKDYAEEQAMKAPIKILFPLLLFIFPVIFIVILWPIAIQLITTMK